jgi:hypothetical protein
MVRTAAAAAFALLSVGVTAADDLQFNDYKSAEGRFFARFPGEVKVTTSKGGNVPTTTHQVAPGGGLLFSVTYFDLPVDVPAEQVKATVRNFATSIKGKVVSAKDVKVGPDKRYGREVVYDRKDTFLRQRVTIDGKRMYAVVVGGTKKEDVTSKDADRFVDAFEVTK